VDLRSTACGVALVCTLPLSVSARQRLPEARTLPGHELESYYQGGCRISVAVSRTSLRSVFSSRFPGSLSSLAASLSESSSGWTQVCPQPLLITVQQNPLAAVLLRQALDSYELSGGNRITPDLILLAVPEFVSSLATLFTRP